MKTHAKFAHSKLVVSKKLATTEKLVDVSHSRQLREEVI
jgi:hypothetical protein